MAASFGQRIKAADFLRNNRARECAADRLCSLCLMILHFECSLSSWLNQAAATSHGCGAASKGQRVRNWQLEPARHSLTLPPLTIERDNARGNASVKNPLQSCEDLGGCLPLCISFPRLNLLLNRWPYYCLIAFSFASGKRLPKFKRLIKRYFLLMDRPSEFSDI